jgi:hypothetical protein
MVVFKWSMMTGSMGECGYMFLGTPWCGWLYSNVWRCGDMAAAICFSIVGLSSLVPFGRRVAEICSAYISQSS